MCIESGREVAVYLNGKETILTGMEFIAGWNTLVFYCGQSGLAPKVSFRRLNDKKVDLTFSLYNGEIKPLRGDITEWRSPGDQKPGDGFGVSLPPCAGIKAVYMNCAAAGENNDRYTPYCFAIEADGKEVYRSDIEERMSYPEGHVFISLDNIPAGTVRFVLAKNALKPWVAGDITFLA
jgi:hypothetical protein